MLWEGGWGKAESLSRICMFKQRQGGAGDKGEDGERNNWGRDISGED